MNISHFFIDRPIFADLFAATTMYHLVSFLVLAHDRMRSDRTRLRALVWVHVLPAALCAALLTAPPELLPALERHAGLAVVEKLVPRTDDRPRLGFVPQHPKGRRLYGLQSKR